MNNNLYSLKVLREGLLTTIQDFGFKNLQHYGIPNGGAIDNFSYQLGNKIISNKYNTPSIEFTKIGPKFLVERGNLNLVVTGFNSYPYETELMVIAPEGAYVVIDDIEVQYGSVDNGHLLYGQENYLTLIN